MTLKIDKYKVLFIIILLAGSFLRFYQLERQSLWFDELGSWETSRSDTRLSKYPINAFSYAKEPVSPRPRNLIEELNVIEKNTLVDRIHLPLYFYFLYFVQKLIGDTPFALRFFSVIAGILSIVFIYLLAKKLYNRKTALISAAIMSVMCYPVYYSQEARMYSFMIFFTIITCYLFLLLYREILRKNRINFIIAACYLVCSLVNSYLHFFTFYFTVLQSLFFFFLLILIKEKNKRYRLTVFIIYFIQFICLIPVIVSSIKILTGFPGIPNMQWIVQENQIEFRHFIIPFNSYLNYPVDFNFHVNPDFFKSGVVRNISIILILLSIFKQYDYCIVNELKISAWLKRIWNRSRSTLVVIFWYMVPVIILFLISLYILPMFIDRYMVFALPALYILVARMLERLTYNKALKAAGIGLFFIIAIIDLFIWKGYYTGVNKMQIRDAVEYIALNKPVDGNAFVAANLGNFGVEYYFNKFNLQKTPILYLQNTYKDAYDKIDISRLPTASRHEINNLKAMVSSGKYTYVWYIEAFYNKQTVPVLDAVLIKRIDFFCFYLFLYKLKSG